MFIFTKLILETIKKEVGITIKSKERSSYVASYLGKKLLATHSQVALTTVHVNTISAE